MGSYSFEYPYVFFLIPFFIICSRFCPIREEVIFFPHLDLLRSGTNNSAFLLRFFKWMSIVLAVIALASPIKKDQIISLHKSGYSIVLALDASGSMRLGFGNRGGMFYVPKDKNSSKFDISIKLAKEFIKKRGDDELGVVVFGNFAYVASPLSFDKDMIEKILDDLKVGIAGSNYTVINDALFISSKLFANSNAKTKIIILITDGQSRGEHIPKDVVLDYINDNGIKVYSIGIGKNGDFDKKYLQKLAKLSGGKSFSAFSKEDLKRVYKEIDRLEKSKIRSKSYIKKSYYYEYPLFFAFLSLLFYGFLLNKRGSV